jgi:hypothetical protein
MQASPVEKEEKFALVTQYVVNIFSSFINPRNLLWTLSHLTGEDRAGMP